MKKLSIFYALLLASATLWAETVTYLDANGQAQSVNATVVTSSTDPIALGTAGQTVWYIVKDTNVILSQGAVCNGAVHLILADGAKLTATGMTDYTNQIYIAGIQVSGDGNSLAIYGQTKQSGQLIANGGHFAAGIGGGYRGSGANITINGGKVTANGDKQAAGIGGGNYGSGSNITINGGTVTANGGYGIGIAGDSIGGAGIGGGYLGTGSNITINGGTVTANGGYSGAGIGGGYEGSASYVTINGGTVTAYSLDGGAGIGGGAYGNGSNITINGDTVTANGGKNADGLGRGKDGTGSNIFVATGLLVKADVSNNPPTTIIAADRTATTDIQNDLAYRQFVFILPDPIPDIKTAAVDSINAAVSENDPDGIKTIAANAVTAIYAAKTATEVETLMTQALDAIASAKSLYAQGKTDGKAELLGAMATPCSNCTAVEVKKDTTTLTLYAPEQVTYLKKEE